MHTGAHQSRSRDHVLPDRHINWPAGRAWARGSVTAWAARIENLPGVRRADFKGSHRSAALCATVGQRIFCRAFIKGVQFRSGGDPVLYLQNPDGDYGAKPTEDARSAGRTARAAIRGARRSGDQRTRRAIRNGVPHADERAGSDGRLNENRRRPSNFTAKKRGKPGTFAANCLLARRLAERDVRFIQLYHPGWDQHGNLPVAIRRQCADVDRAELRADHRSQATRTCSMTRSSSGAANSVARIIRKAS